LVAGKKLSSVIPSVFLRYAFFHSFFAITFVVAAVTQVRRLALSESLPKLKRSQRRSRMERWFRIGNEPMMWKELCIDRGLSFNRFGKVFVLLIVLGSFIPAVWNLGWIYWQINYPNPNSPFSYSSPSFLPEMMGRAINDWVKQVGIAVACLTILGAAVRAASSVSGEQEQQTFDSLLASPLETSRILLAKWASSIWSVRWGFLWLCLVWTIGILMGGLSPVTVPWLILCWLIYAVFFTALGLWFSVRTNKTLTATVWTLTCTVALSVGQLLPWLLMGIPTASVLYGNGNWDLRSLANFQVFGMSPPVAIGWFSFRGLDMSFFTSRSENPVDILMMIVAGLIIWIIGACILWALACWRLSRERVDAHSRPSFAVRSSFPCSPSQPATILPVASDCP
jgi:hypothetical protein